MAADLHQVYKEEEIKKNELFSLFSQCILSFCTLQQPYQEQIAQINDGQNVSFRPKTRMFSPLVMIITAAIRVTGECV